MDNSHIFSLSLNRRDAVRVNRMAAALAIPASEFLSQAVDSWLKRPKRFKKLAKRIVKERSKSLPAKQRKTEMAATRKRVKALAKRLKAG
jgi:hypothetical protein